MLGFAQEQEDQAVFVLYISHAEKLELSCVNGGIHLSGRDGPSASSGGEPSNLLQHVQRSINVDSRVLQKRHKCLPKIVSRQLLHANNSPDDHPSRPSAARQHRPVDPPVREAKANQELGSH